MSLPRAVQGARHTAVALVWADPMGTPQDLSGAELSGTLRNIETDETAAIDGDLTITDAAAGAFAYQYGPGDVAAAGTYEVQFTAAYGDELVDRNPVGLLIVERANLAES